ncbi:2Fe-2S iron-sulfur cluster-binding protein [Xanthovirga aplysinae]|uniref:2Fe-2S iron-sulfur cluster-binding protein n=1 Tax=Xanthovirga aplysinae TaxID=2529853 RepID=UPI0012BBFF0E|nr:2Fe-2S iron-sulfur cluster-binding protein [Xanthovirga aplysinae]MTI33621.1 (2Fe-2S)-binding protein [Xanthovirga aplysinae]
MPKIQLQNLSNKEIISNNKSKSILQDILENGIDWLHACGGKGRCTTCKMVIISGEGHLSPLSVFEQKMIKLKKLGDHERLSCQCTTDGDLVIRVAEENKMPHMSYSD